MLPKGEIVDKDYFAGGDSVTVAGTINGDAYLGGGKIIIDGNINGDLIAGGGEIIINGDVSQNIRVAGGNITVNGNIGRNATVLGGNVNFTNSSKISGSLVSGAGNLNLYAPVGKELYLGVGDGTIGSPIGGDINAGAGNLTLTSGALVSGNLNYVSNKTIRMLPGALVSGQLTHKLPPKTEPQVSKKDAALLIGGFALFLKIVSLVSLTVIGLLVIRFLPKFTTETAKTFGSNFWISLVVGVLTLFLAPLTFLLLLITVFGLPLAFITIFVLGIAVYISKIFVSVWLGNYIALKLNQSWNIYISFITGIFLLTVISFIPILGTIVGIIAATGGLGALLVAKKNFYLKFKEKL